MIAKSKEVRLWRGPKAVTRKRGPKILSKLYGDSSPYLFVPTEGMLLIRAAAVPKAILERLDLPATLWEEWSGQFDKQPWLKGWLYHDKLPSGIRRRYSYDELGTLTLSDFLPSKEMEAFRTESSQRAICRAATALRHGHEGTSHTNLVFYLDRHKALDWFKGWLLRGDDPIAAVTIASVDEVLAMREACDYVAFSCGGEKGSVTSFDQWLRRRTFPARDTKMLREWIGWLYGGPSPEGWFIITDAMQRIRDQRTIEGWFAAAGSNGSVCNGWMQDGKLRAALFAARDESNREKRNRIIGQLDTDGRTKAAMRRVCAAWQLGAVCTRASTGQARVRKNHYHDAIKDAGTHAWHSAEAKEANQRKAEFELIARRFLCGYQFADQGETRRFTRTGVVASFVGSTGGECGIFLPQKAMVEFRNRAIAAKAYAQIARVLKKPHGEAWLFDWGLPQSRFGTRSIDALLVKPPAATPPARRRVGRKPNNQTQEMQELCYRLYFVEGKKRSRVRALVCERFPLNGPKSNANVTNYSRRYAKAKNLPFAARS